MVSRIFIECKKKLRKQGKKKILGSVSLCCLAIIIAAISILCAGNNMVVIVGIFYAAILIFVRVNKLEDALLSDWSRLPEFIHYGIAAGALIVTCPLIFKIYVRGSEQEK